MEGRGWGGWGAAAGLWFRFCLLLSFPNLHKAIPACRAPPPTSPSPGSCPALFPGRADLSGGSVGGRRQDNHPNPLFPLPLEIFRERKQSFSWGAGVWSHRIKTRQGTVPGRDLVPSPLSASQLLALAAPFKTHLGSAGAQTAQAQGLRLL